MPRTSIKFKAIDTPARLHARLLVVVALWCVAASLTACSSGPGAKADAQPQQEQLDLALGEAVSIGSASVRIPEGWSLVAGDKAFWRETGSGDYRAEMAISIAKGKPQGMSYEIFWEEFSADYRKKLAETHEVRDEGPVALGSLQAYSLKFYRTGLEVPFGVRMYLIPGVTQTYVLTFASTWDAFESYEVLFRRSAESVSVSPHGSPARRIRLGDGSLELPEGWGPIKPEDGVFGKPDELSTLKALVDTPKEVKEGFWENFSTNYRAKLPPESVVLEEQAFTVASHPAYMLQLRLKGDVDLGLTLIVIATKKATYLLTYGTRWESYEKSHELFMKSAQSFEEP